MKVLTPLAALLGLALLTALTAYYGFSSVGRAVASAGWGVLLLVLARTVALAGAGIGWGVLLEGVLLSRPWLFVGLRFIREAINCLFPVAQVGGDLIGARLLTFFGIGRGLAFASVLIDIFVQVASLVLFVLAGTAILPVISDDHGLVATVAYGLVLAVPAIAAFFVVLQIGASSTVMARLGEIAHVREWTAMREIANLGENLQGLWRRPWALVASFGVHTAIWFFGAIEVFLGLYFMGHSVTIAQAIVIESIGQGVRAAAFAVPGGLGVQDGGLIAVCAVCGVPAEVALALALLKRMAELGLGIPSLLAWQALEGRRFMTEKRRQQG